MYEVIYRTARGWETSVFTTTEGRDMFTRWLTDEGTEWEVA